LRRGHRRRFRRAEQPIDPGGDTGVHVRIDALLDRRDHGRAGGPGLVARGGAHAGTQHRGEDLAQRARAGGAAARRISAGVAAHGPRSSRARQAQPLIDCAHRAKVSGVGLQPDELRARRRLEKGSALAAWEI
jgi:hypothetical protein